MASKLGEVSEPLTDTNVLRLEPKEPEQEQVEKQAKEGSLFTFRTDLVKTSWHHEVFEPSQYIQITIEQLGDPTTNLVICDQIPPQLLFSLAPALQNDLHDRRIVLPASTALDDDTVNDVVNDILECARKGKHLALHMHRGPVRLIKVHCVLVRFGMQKEADTLLEALWELMRSKQLTLGDILWIWDTFADPWARNGYVAPAADEYIQMIAWQIVNMDAEGKLSDDIKKAIEEEQEPRYFFEMLKKRVEEFGLGRQRLVPMGDAAQGAETCAVHAGTAPFASLVSTPPEVPPKQSTLREQYSEYQKDSVASKMKLSSDKPHAPTLSDTSLSQDRDPFSKLRAITEKAPKFTSAGFMHSIEPVEPGKSQQQRPAFGQPERRFSYSATTPSSLATETLAAAPNESNSFGGGLRVSGILPNTATPPAQPAGANNPTWNKIPWGFGSPKQNNLTMTSTSAFGSNSSAPLPQNTTSRVNPWTQFPGTLAPPPQSAQSSFNFDQAASQTPSSIAPASGYQFRGGLFNTPSPNPAGTMEQSFGSFGSSTALNTIAGSTSTSSPSPFGDSPFGSISNDAAANGMFTLPRTASSGGGMVRKFATARGTKRTRRH